MVPLRVGISEATKSKQSAMRRDVRFLAKALRFFGKVMVRDTILKPSLGSGLGVSQCLSDGSAADTAAFATTA
jgi:hypothetical protein